MRNLKKALSLALALVMLLGMMMVGAGAATEINDIDSVEANNQEAVKVMNALGILVGDENHNFNGTGTLNRAAAAKIVLSVARGLGIVDASLKTQNSVMFDDMTGDEKWAAGIVDVCETLGIVKGTGDREFSPEDKVTVLQFATMLTRVIDADNADKYADAATYEVNVKVFAYQAKMDDKVGITDWNADMTREQAAQMAFNALTYGNKNVVTTSNKYVVASTATEVNRGSTSGLGLFKKADNTAPGSGDTEPTYGAADNKVTFAGVAGAVNGGTYATYDAAMKAGTGVVFGYKAKGAAAAGEAVKALYGTHFTITPMTITETVTEGSRAWDIFKLSSTTSVDQYGNPSKAWKVDGATKVEIANGTVFSTTDGVTSGQLYTALGLKKDVDAATRYVDGNKTTCAIASGDDTVIAGKGAEVNVYKAGNDYTITVKNTYVGTISAWNKAVTNDDGQITSKEKITIANQGAAAGTMVSMDFETTAFTKDDANVDPAKATVVLYTVKYNESGKDAGKYSIATVAVAESVTAVATRINADDTVVADGTTYGYSANVSDLKKFETLDGEEAVLYLDNYGNIIYTANVADAAPNYAVIIGLASSGATGSMETTNRGQLLLADGSNVIANYALAAGYSTAALYDVVTYTVDAEGTYKLTKAATLATGGNMFAINDTITTNVPTLKGTTTADNKTIFLVKTGTAATAYTAYVGISSVPSLTVKTITDARVVLSGTTAQIVFLPDIQQNGSTSSSKDLVFIAGQGKATTELVNGNPVTTFEHAAVVNGQITTVITGNSSDDPIKGNVLTSGLVYTNGAISGVTKANGNTNGTGVTAIGLVNAAGANGLITINGTKYVYSDNTEVYKVADGKIEESSIGEIVANNTIVAGYEVDHVLTVLYVSETVAPAAATATSTATKDEILGDNNTDRAPSKTDVTSTKPVKVFPAVTPGTANTVSGVEVEDNAIGAIKVGNKVYAVRGKNVVNDPSVEYDVWNNANVNPEDVMSFAFTTTADNKTVTLVIKNAAGTVVYSNAETVATAGTYCFLVNVVNTRITSGDDANKVYNSVGNTFSGQLVANGTANAHATGTELDRGSYSWEITINGETGVYASDTFAITKN